MKKHSLFALLIILLLVLGNLGSVPFAGDPQTEPTQVVYLPVVLQDYSPLPPAFSTSYYVQLSKYDSQSKHFADMQALGCRIGNLEQSLPGAQDHIVILALGQPWTTGGQYQVSIYRPPGVNDWLDANISYVGELVKQVIAGYWACKDNSSVITFALGVNTYGKFGNPKDAKIEQYVDEAFGHGYYFAKMVESVVGWTISQGYSNRIAIAGALDSEPAFNPPIISKEWVRGFIQANTGLRYFNYGTCDGCPYDEKPDLNPANGWTLEDLWEISWGVPPAWTIPEIYYERLENEKWININAKQWKFLSRYSWNQHGQKIEFAGTLTQNQACAQKGGCVYSNERTDITPLEGWWALYNELNKDPATAQSFLRWSSDMRWSIK